MRYDQDSGTGAGRSRRRMQRRLLVWASVGATLVLVTASVVTAAQKDIFGWVEWVAVGTDDIELKAKLDTGADTSSLDAASIRRLRRRSTGERFVEFELGDGASGEPIILKRPLVREVRIKQHDGSFQTRPVVEIEVCLGERRRMVEVSLIDRSEFIYPMLLGRSALTGIAVVDPQLTFTQGPSCSRPEDAS